MEITCKQCTKIFATKPSQVAIGKGKFCSRKCYGIWLSKNRKYWGVNSPSFNQERLKEIRKQHSIKLTGRKLSEETKKKLREINIRIGLKPPILRGEKHWHWKGGTWLYIRKQTLKRDNYTCQCKKKCWWHKGKKCNFRDRKIMEVDHMKSRKTNPELKLNMDNLITICPNCHRNKTNKEAKFTSTH